MSVRHVAICLLAVAGCGSPPTTSTITSGAVTPCPTPGDRLRALAADLDANPDELHLDITPAVRELTRAGVLGACAVLPQLLAGREETRLHALRVMQGVLADEQGFRSGRGYGDSYGGEQAEQIERAIDYAVDAPVEARRAGAERWRHWLERRSPRVFDGPTPAEMASALAPVRPRLEACGEPVDLTVEFDRSGTITSIWGTAATTESYRACLRTATAAVRLAPFDRANVWIRYP